MIAFVTSIGEATTDLCVWSLERQGFVVELVQNNSSLAEKLKLIYDRANEDFLRVDADIITNKNASKLEPADGCLWHQSMGWDWYSQELKPISVQYIKKEALPVLRSNINAHLRDERPESAMFRLEEFHNPRVCEVTDTITGLHGYKGSDFDRVKQQKIRRGQIDKYDFELAERINAL